MPLLSKITIKNFKSFRKQIFFDLSDGSYFVGINNSGKSTVLSAINVFFNEGILQDESFVNKTSFLSKKEGSNKVEISIKFHLEALTTKKFKQDLIKKYGTDLDISKIISVTTDTKIISYSYRLNNENIIKYLPEEVIKLIKSVRVTYLHPQEGQTLLINAQEKLRQRLLANWGRGANITQSIIKLQSEWNELRKQTTSYLSKSLTDNLQKMWPDSEVTINLPKDIKDIISVSDINFSGYRNAPEIDLTSQGTGAQSTILYLTHFLLDSDRSLHRGEYHPLWLLEEPESFLHIDLLANLAKQLNSERWLDNIQMVISTHSPVLLASSRIAQDKISWSILRERSKRYNKLTTEYSDNEIKDIGELMGDPNFFAYFLAAQSKFLVFVEDEKSITVEKYRTAGINITKGLKGTLEMSKCLEIFLAVPFILNDKCFFIIDSDKGKSEFSRFYNQSEIKESKNGFSRFKVKNSENIYLIFLPNNFAVEKLFSEFGNHLEECIDKIWDVDSWNLKETIPTNLSSVGSYCRRNIVSSKSEAISLVQNQKDIKSLFWEKVKKFDYKINQKYVSTLNSLIGS